MSEVYVKDAAIELLAIKLHEHSGVLHPQTLPGWLSISEAKRDTYRGVARGELPFSTIQFFQPDQ